MQIRTFKTGATRNSSEEKLDYEGFLSPEVLHRFAQYMHFNRKQKDGTIRSSDNWQKGIDINEYMKSLKRHEMDLWRMHRNDELIIMNEDTGKPFTKEELLCAIMFNVMGYLFEELKKKSLDK